ncbi:MAG TPA: type II/IV secretion system protein, partial [Candidatus Marinimicrobia bacterium]|nr:type II/IV secretion system protein [Candidatus Neomarinimicrobiota bacterium]
MSKFIGEILLEKEIISQEQLKAALEIQASEPHINRRQVGRILYEDLGVDRHKVLKELTSLFAIREMEITPDMITEEKNQFITELLDNYSDDFRAALIKNKIVPFEIENKKGETTLTVLCADPTNTEIKSLIEQLPFSKYEIVYNRMENIDGIISKSLSSRNEFFSLLDDMEYEEEAKDEAIDEAALDAEINQSALTALVDGILIEAVRQGISDVHIVPQPGNLTDFNFRRDGKLQTYYTQKGVK